MAADPDAEEDIVGQKPPRRDARGLISAILLTLVIVVTLAWKFLPSAAAGAFWLSSSGPASASASASGLLGDHTAAEEVQPLAIALHPELHVLRAPEALFFRWNVSAGFRAPDGVQKRVYLVNGEFPCPTIEARSGDEIVVEVYNGLDDEDVSLHWHGLRLHGQNAYDGAVGFTQCPLKPGRTFTYRVRIGDDEHGTYWWHAHNQVQRGDGLYGGLVIHRPKEQQQQQTTASEEAVSLAEMERYDYDDEALLMIGDWFHASAQDTLKWYKAYEHFGSEPVPDSLVINGKGHFNCSLAVPARPLVCAPAAPVALQALGSGATGRTRWRIVNTGQMAGFNISSHTLSMTPIQVDGGHEVAAVPGLSVGILHPGERVDVIVEPHGTTSSGQETLVVTLDNENFKYVNPTLNPVQLFNISEVKKQESRNNDDSSTTPVFVQEIVDLASLKAASSIAATTPFPTTAQETIVLYAKTQILAKYSNSPKGYLNHTSWAPQSPPLLALDRSSWNEDQFAPFISLPSPSTAAAVESPKWVDVVINNLDDGSHPFHLHGHAFYVLSSFRAPGRKGAWGSYNPFATAADGTTPGPSAGLDLVTPLMKDTVSVPRRGYVVIRFRADNPGVWMLHCHMLVHLGSGMAMGLHVGAPGDEEHVAGLESQAADLC